MNTLPYRVLNALNTLQFVSLKDSEASSQVESLI